METQRDVHAAILKVTMSIMEKYPELYEKLGEMPVTVPDIGKPEINIASLQAYYDSLKSILRNYVLEHNLS